MSQETVIAYTRPTVYLPFDSQIPPLAPASAGEPETSGALQQVARAAGSLSELLTRHVVSAPELAGRLVGLKALVDAVDPLVAVQIDGLAATMTPKLSADAVEAALKRDANVSNFKETFDHYVIYDHYFHVLRVASMTGAQFAAQVAATWRELLADLPYAVLGIDDIMALLLACRLMFQTIAPAFGTAALTQTDAIDEAAIGALEPQPAADDTVIAFYRWTEGHHTFDLCAIFCRDRLLRAIQAVASDDEAAIVVLLGEARQLLRATTAAMWYTTNFPIMLYSEQLRPSMSRTGAHGGFSGTQNADYERMKATKELVKETLFNRFGDDPAAWPQAVYGALVQFNEIDVEDTEHHILIAAAKVAMDESLAQMAWQPAQGTASNAVEALRDMAEAARQDLAERFKPSSRRRVRICGTADVPRERPLGAMLGNERIVVCRAFGQYWALGGICSHQGADLAEGHMAEDGIVCPLHAAKFDPRTGAALRRPATQPLQTFGLVEDGDDLYVELPD